jgi:hypothetical protein
MLARVCELHVFKALPRWSQFDISKIAPILRASPQLRTFSSELYLLGDTSWLTESTAPLHPEFVGLVHPRLRHLAVNARVSSSRDDDCASRLRRACFPALEVLEVGRETFFVTSLPAS